MGGFAGCDLNLRLRFAKVSASFFDGIHVDINAEEAGRTMEHVRFRVAKQISERAAALEYGTDVSFRSNGPTSKVLLDVCKQHAAGDVQFLGSETRNLV